MRVSKILALILADTYQVRAFIKSGSILIVSFDKHTFFFFFFLNKLNRVGVSVKLSLWQALDMRYLEGCTKTAI